MSKFFKCLALACALLPQGLPLLAQDYGTAAVSVASGDDLYKTADVNLTNTFPGVFSGMAVRRGSGEIGGNMAGYLIRGMGSFGVDEWSKARLFVDGFEVNKEYLASIAPAEIEKVEVLKDAAALSLYGERGANGVIAVTTRRGVAGPSTVSARVRYGVQAPSSLNKPLDAYHYAMLYNQAVSNDNGMVWSPAYSQEQLDAYRDGAGVNVDWYAETLRRFGSYMDADVILQGGSSAARYNVNLDYLGSKGLLNVRDTDQTRNLGARKFNVRANLDFDVLRIFQVRMDIGGRVEFLHRPNYTVSTLFGNLARYPSNIYPVFDDEAGEHYSGTGVFPNNPYGSITGLGWFSAKARSLQTNLSVKERLDDLAEGLYLEEAVSFYSYTRSTYSKTRDYARWRNGATTTTNETTTITASGYGSAGMQDWKQGRITAGYDHAFGRHHLTAAANGLISAYKGDGYFSYKNNTLNFNGFLRYNFVDRYILEAAVSMFGNDAFAPGHRWHPYPAVSGAWVLSNEPFLQDSRAVRFLKLRASAGLTGASESGATSVLSDFNSGGRFLYKDYYTYSYIGTFYAGTNPSSWQNTLVPMFIGNADIAPEQSLKLDAGFDADLAGGFHLSADVFFDRRSGILTLDRSLMAYYGKQYAFSNLGRMRSGGVEASAAWSGKAGHFSWRLDGNVLFCRDIVDEMAEVPTANPFSAATGRPYGTYIGLVADGFFGTGDFDDDGRLVPSLPTPAFGAVQPGDVKYLDLDRNGIVDQNDVTRIGYGRFPEWNFAFGAKLCYRGFDLEIRFQGLAGVAANLLDNKNQTVAFVDNGNAYALAQDAWAYYPVEGIDNRAGAKYPRLTTRGNENNYRLSSLWVKDASFLKLRNLTVGYTFPKQPLRFYVSGENLLTFSPLLAEYGLDPENISGLYPQLRSLTAGLAVTF